MLDLRQKLEDTARHLEAFLSESKAKRKALGLLFYHTHPNYGQSHLYLSEDESVIAEEQILGVQAIDAVLDYKGWLESTTWWEGESPDGKRELIRLSGESIHIENNSEFNAIWAADVEIQIRELCQTIASDLLPKRIVVSSQNGEYQADWYTAPKAN